MTAKKKSQRLNATVWVKAENSDVDMVSFGSEDSDIPKWAADQIGPHAWEDDESGSDSDSE